MKLPVISAAASETPLSSPQLPPESKKIFFANFSIFIKVSRRRDRVGCFCGMFSPFGNRIAFHPFKGTRPCG
jgi:hypothetical protein